MMAAMIRRPVTLVLTAVIAASGAAASASPSRIPRQWSNCKAVNARYHHGVGKLHAHDHTSGVPVKNFKHSTRLYNRAIHYNKGLDRDHDGIACEQ